MIKQKICLCITLTFFLCFAQSQNTKNKFDENGKRHGYWSKNYPGKDLLRYSGNFHHGKEIDTFKYYTIENDKSVLSAIKIFNKNDDVAKVIYMTSAGNIISEGLMDGKKHIGKWIYYHKNSKIKMIEEYYNKEGLLEGVKSIFYNNGNKAERAIYKNGKLNGESIWYSIDNNITRISNYKDGELHGKTTYYDKFKHKTDEGVYNNGKKSGVWTYYKSGKIYKKINHNDNEVIFSSNQKKR